MPDPLQQAAHEQLRVIRSLMERATIYRSISSLTAFVGGALSVIVHLLIRSASPVSPAYFLGLWSIVLACTILASIVSLFLGSVKRQEPFFSSGQRLALISLAPSALFAVTVTFAFYFSPNFYFVVPIWITIYGIAILSTQHFAPPSLIILGWSFLIAGIFILITSALNLLPLPADSALASSLLMALTFGLFHLVYALADWIGSRFATKQEGANV